MKFKYLFGIFAIFLLLASVSAAKDISQLTDEELNNLNYFDRVIVFNLEGFNFTIPFGYGSFEDYSINDTNSKGVTQVSKFFASKDYNVISISLIYGEDINLDINHYKPRNVENLKKETINEHTGWCYKSGDYAYFTYIDNGNVIILQASDKDLFKLILS